MVEKTPAETAAILRQLHDRLRGGTQWAPTMGAEAVKTAIELIESAEEDRALCDKLADILTRTANVLKGEPKPLHRHSWHDLPEVARRLVAAAGQNTINAMLAHSRKAGKQRTRKLLAKHGKETGK